MQKSDEQFLKDKDFWISLVFDRPLSVPIVKLMRRLKVRIHPNVISLLSLLPVLLAGFLFFNSQLVIGAICYYIYFILDGIDGKWARITGQRSRVGGRLDVCIATIGGFIMYFGLWYSQYYVNGSAIIGGLVIFCHYVVVALNLTIFEDEFYDTGIPRVGSYYSPEEEAFFTFFVATIMNIVSVAIPLFISLQALFVVIRLFRQNNTPRVKEIRENIMKKILKRYT